MRREVDRLLGGPALPVDSGGGDGIREARGEEGVAGDVQRLFAHLADAARDDVLHHVRFEARATHHLLQHLRQQRYRVHAAEAASPTPYRRSHRLDDNYVLIVHV